MTIIVGAYYRDGVILAADRRTMRGSRIGEGRKLSLMNKETVAIGFTGAMGVIDVFKQNLRDHPALGGARTIYEVLEIMKDVIAEISFQYIRRGTFSEEQMVFEAIVCGLEQLNFGSPRLFHLTHRGYSEVISGDSNEPYFLIGSATGFAESLLKSFFNRDLPKEGVIELISYIVRQAEQFDSSIGGDPSIVLIEPNKLPHVVEEETIVETIRKVDDLNSSLSGILKGVFRKGKDSRLFEGIINGLGGVTHENRKYYMKFSHYTDLGPDLIRVEMVRQYVAVNNSDVTKDLFRATTVSGVLVEGSVTIPKLKGLEIPEDPKIFWNLEQMCVDGEAKLPRVVTDWFDQTNRSKGLGYSVTLPERIQPLETRHISFSTMSILDAQDCIVQRINHLGKDIEIALEKPEDIDVNLIWFLNLEARRGPPKISATSYSQKVSGLILPGNGFVVLCGPRT